MEECGTKYTSPYFRSSVESAVYEGAVFCSAGRLSHLDYDTIMTIDKSQNAVSANARASSCEGLAWASTI